MQCRLPALTVEKASYLSVLELHGKHQLMSVVSKGFPVISFGEECRAQISMSSAFSCLVTCVTCKQNKD